MSEKYVYHFEEAYGLGKELLGGKGAGLAEMTHIGVSIPQGFTITTEACTLYYENEKLTADLHFQFINCKFELCPVAAGRPACRELLRSKPVFVCRKQSD